MLCQFVFLRDFHFNINYLLLCLCSLFMSAMIDHLILPWINLTEISTYSSFLLKCCSVHLKTTIITFNNCNLFSCCVINVSAEIVVVAYTAQLSTDARNRKRPFNFGSTGTMHAAATVDDATPRKLWQKNSWLYNFTAYLFSQDNQGQHSAGKGDWTPQSQPSQPTRFMENQKFVGGGGL